MRGDAGEIRGDRGDTGRYGEIRGDTNALHTRCIRSLTSLPHFSLPSLTILSLSHFSLPSITLTSAYPIRSPSSPYANLKEGRSCRSVLRAPREYIEQEYVNTADTS